MKLHPAFTLVEILLAIGLSAIFLPALALLISFSITASTNSRNYTAAVQLAQHEMEIINQQSQSHTPGWDWVHTPSNTTASTTHGIFTSSVQIQPVSRCGIEICPFGTTDDYTRSIIVTVSWTENSRPQSISLNSYVSYH